MPARTPPIEPIDKDEALAGTAFPESDNVTNRQAVPQQDQFLKLHVRFWEARAVRFVRFAQAFSIVERDNLWQRGRVRLNGNFEYPAKRSESGALCTRPRTAKKDVQRAARRAATPRLIGDHEAPPQGRQTVASQISQSADNLRANPMRYQSARQLGAPVLAQDGVIRDLRTHNFTSLAAKPLHGASDRRWT
ncbi:MAG: hypothetical protein ACREQ5_09855, partial [Candidatus Dormibacteria bacterium]